MSSRLSGRGLTRGLIVVLIGLLGFLAGAGAEVRYRPDDDPAAGRLTVAFDTVTLEQALTEIAKAAAIDVRSTAPMTEKITVGFTDVPLIQGLRRL